MGVGDLATWVGSIGIVATLAVTGRQLERERRLRRREEHRSQAIEISAWPGGADLQPVGPVQLPNGTLIMVANHSHQPIYEVVVTLVSVQGAGPQAGGDWVAEAEPGSGRLPLGAAFVAVGPGNWTVTVSDSWHGCQSASEPRSHSPTPEAATGCGGPTASLRNSRLAQSSTTDWGGLSTS